MDKTGADAYVYAKACGMYARSFVGSRARKLFELKRLQDLWSVLFSDEAPVLPEGLLALQLERRASERMLGDFLTLLSCYDSPDPLSRALLVSIEYNNLKAASVAASLGQSTPPFMLDLGEYALFNKQRWPDIAGMTMGTSAQWFNRSPVGDEQIEWETRLDHMYYRQLWTALESLPPADRKTVEEPVREEIILQNIVWALRLKVYYGKQAEEIMPLLAGADFPESVRDALCGPSAIMLSKSPDHYEEWAHWKYAWLLNPHEEGVPWFVDPRWVQLSSDKYLYRAAIRRFHQSPFTPGVLFSFFKIKQLEEHMIRVAAEGLRLGATDSQMNEFTGD